MAQVVEFGNGAAGKIRSFWVWLGLDIITLGIYHLFWYYLTNEELKDIGIDKDDQNLANSSPGMSVLAITLGAFIIIPPFLSVYNFGNRILRAERLTGVPRQHQINPVLAFLLFFPGYLLVVPIFFHYWYVIKHQNMAVRAAGGLPYKDEVPALGAADAQPVAEPSIEPATASAERPATPPPPPPAE
jgi:Domain of unknown function (DUF4234)